MNLPTYTPPPRNESDKTIAIDLEQPVLFQFLASLKKRLAQRFMLK